MRIIDGLKLKGKPAEIPDCSRDDLPGFFVEMDYKVGAEIGSAEGQFTETLCKAGLVVYAIDPWLAYDGYNDSTLQQRLDNYYKVAKARLTPYPNCKIIKKMSSNAVTDFEDGSLDFVYIDGNHEFRFVAEDIALWSTKVRSGGIISGHDYVSFRTRTPMGVCHVVEVVNAYTQAFAIENWYVLGQKHAGQGEKRDKWRSWMWIKP